MHPTAPAGVRAARLGPIPTALAALALLSLPACERAAAPHAPEVPPAAQPVAPVDPVADNYYADIAPDLAGQSLRAALHRLIRTHRTLDYGETWHALTVTDADPDNPGHVIMIYGRWSRTAAHRDDAGELVWNREHLWPKSRGGFDTDPGVGTDLHMLRASDLTTNAARANLDFDDGGEPYVDPDGPTLARSDADSWEPPDAVKGDIARAMFYAAIRYEDPALDLELTEDVTADKRRHPHVGRLSTLLRWHAADPVDAAERTRNARVHEIQGNRNPFIDHPEWVERIWR